LCTFDFSVNEISRALAKQSDLVIIETQLFPDVLKSKSYSDSLIQFCRTRILGKCLPTAYDEGIANIY
jgi:hypothetical protein